LASYIEAKFNDRGYVPVAGMTSIAIESAVAVFAFATAIHRRML
jgi:hypothetical protein